MKNLRAFLLLFLSSLIIKSCFSLTRNFAFNSFPSSTNLVTNGGIYFTPQNQLGLTTNQTNLANSAWFYDLVYVDGFDVNFTFVITDLAAIGRDGLAFVIQSVDTNQVSVSGAGIAYGDRISTGNSGIPRSLAIELDTHYDPDLGDPANNHISVHTRQLNPNSANESFSLQIYSTLIDIRTSEPFQVRIVYRKPSLQVFFGTIQLPLISISNFDLTTQLATVDGQAYIGFTSSTGPDGGDAHLINNWTYLYQSFFCPANSAPLNYTTNLVAGTTNNFTIQAFDNYNHPMLTGGATITLFLSNNATITFNVFDYANGFYFVYYSATFAYSGTLDVRMNNISIKGAPLSITILPSDPNTTLSIASGSGLQGGIAGDLQSFQVTVYDRYNNIVTQQANVAVQISGVSNIPANVGPGINGIYAVTYNPSIVGSYIITITVNGGLIGAGNYSMSVSAGPVIPRKCVISPITPTLTAGQTVPFTLTTYDDYGNKITQTTGITVTASMTGPSTFNINWSSYNDGIYTFQFQLTLIGTYSLNVNVNGQPAGNAPYAIQVQAGAAVAQNSYITGSNSSIAGNNAVAFLFAYDSYGNPVTNPTPWTSFIQYNVNQTFNSSVLTYMGANSYSLTANFTLATTYTYFVYIGINQIQNSSNYKVFVSTAPLNLNMTVVQGNGVINATVNIRSQFSFSFYDSYKNPIVYFINLFVNITNEQPELSGIPHTVANQSNGTYVISYTPLDSGFFYINATVNGTRIPGSPWRIEVPGFSLSPAEIAMIVFGSIGAVCLIIFIVVIVRRKKFRYSTLR